MVASSAPFSWPLRGKILKGFSKSGAGGRNDGLNIEGALGDSIQAARQGQVVYVGNELHGFGHLILIKHDDEWMSAYAHLSQVHVQRGASIKRGQIIGLVGSSGSVSHPQLHFEVRQYSQPVDPRRFLE
jgi:murein DD-endopeptidase MepM/ murein hydrolase activator NlpD